MHKFKVFTHALLLATMPSLLVYPEERVVFQEQRVEEKEDSLSYDDVVRLLDAIETEELEEKCSDEELERINHFVAFLAKEGALSDGSLESLSLEDDIKELLDGSFDEYDLPLESLEYMVIPAVFNGYGEVVLCKSWLKKRWKQTKKFVKKHKKAIIIGAVIVVATAVIVVAVAAPPVAAAAVGTAGGVATSGSHKREQKEEASTDVLTATQEAPTLKAAMNDQVSAFKENIIKEQFFPPLTPQQGLSWEENGRVLGSLFAHESLKNLENQIPNNPKLAQELQNIGSKYPFPGTPVGHPEIDRMFSTNYTHLYATAGKEADFNTLSYQVRGEKALAFGYYDQAVRDFGKAIEMNPMTPLPYLTRGVAHFGLGQYDRSLEDYHRFSSQTYPLSIPDFSLGFAKGLPKGVYESGRGMLMFLSDVVTHPIHTGGQMWEALTVLSKLACSEQWSTLSEVLAPEAHQLVKEWDTLPSDKRGELAGYVFGKYGSDILIPGTLAKAVSKGLKGAQELSVVYKSLQTAEQTLLLESVAGLENGAKIGKVVQLEKQISSWLGEGTQVIRNKAGDPVFLSKDGLRKLRFDFNRPAPHESPHLHFEHFIEGEWQEINRIYPNDVPHK